MNNKVSFIIIIQENFKLQCEIITKDGREIPIQIKSNIEEYELMAKAYANELKKQGFRIVRIDNDQTLQLAIEIMVWYNC